MTGGPARRLRVFAVTQIAASFVLLAGAAMLVKTLLALQAVDTGVDMRRVLTVNVPVISYGRPMGRSWTFIRRRSGASSNCPASMAWRSGC
jgi:putative ABC transport system permease protein